MRHGTQTGYKRGCRCDECRGAHNATQRDYYRERRGIVKVDRKLLGDLLHELFPDGLTDDCPARREKATA